METADFENVNIFVKPFTSDWDLNWPKHSLPMEVTHTVSGPNETQVHDVSLQQIERETER